MTIEDLNGESFVEVIDVVSDQVKESVTRIKSQTGNIIFVYLAWRGKNYCIQMFFPQTNKPTRREVQDQLEKVYPGAKLWNYQVSNYDPGEPLLQAGGRK